MNEEQMRAEFEAWWKQTLLIEHGKWKYADMEALLLQAWLAALQSADERVRELEKDAARYRWLRKGANDEVAVVCGLGAMDYGMSGVAYTYSEEIDGDDLDTTIDQAIASMSSGENHDNQD